MKIRVAAALMMASLLPAIASRADDFRGYARSRHDSGYSYQRVERGYARPGTRIEYRREYPQPYIRPRCEPTPVLCYPRQVWQPGYWVMQDMGCGRYHQSWQPGRYVLINTPGLVVYQSW